MLRCHLHWLQEGLLLDSLDLEFLHNGRGRFLLNDKETSILLVLQRLGHWDRDLAEELG